MKPITRILVPTDFSPCATRALEYAIELSSKLSASIVLVHVYLPPVVYMPDGIWALPQGAPNVFDKLREALDKLAAQTRVAASRPVETVLVEGDPAKEIVKAAADYACDLIVIGTHGRTGLSHLVLGSVAEKVVRRGHCPVLSVALRDPS